MQKYHALEFLRPLIDCMKQPQPETRPAAGELMTMFRQICVLQDTTAIARRRLSLKSEAVYGRVFNSYVVPAWEGLSQLKPFSFAP